jgi:hypothetical protein
MSLPRRYSIPLGAALFAVLLSFVAVPTRSMLEQQLGVRRASAELSELQTSNEDLREKLDEVLQDDAIERQAREQFGLVYPGEESYTVPPAPVPDVNLPRGWPFELLQDPLSRSADRRRVEASDQLGISHDS